MTNKTDVEKKMQDVAKGGYRVLKNEHEPTLAKIIARTARKMEDLTGEELGCIEFAVDGIIKKHEIRGSDND